MVKALSLEEEFNRDCTIIDLNAEYPSLVGREKYAVATDLALETLESKYGVFLQPIKPYVIVPKTYLAIKNEYDNNENKHSRRLKKAGDIELDEETVIASGLYTQYDSVQDSVNAMELDNYVQIAISRLSPLAKHRLIQFAYEGMSLHEIAAAEGVDYSIIQQSIRRSQKRLVRILKNEFDINLPYKD